MEYSSIQPILLVDIMPLTHKILFVYYTIQCWQRMHCIKWNIGICKWYSIKYRIVCSFNAQPNVFAIRFFSLENSTCKNKQCTNTISTNSPVAGNLPRVCADRHTHTHINSLASYCVESIFCFWQSVSITTFQHHIFTGERIDTIIFHRMWRWKLNRNWKE